MDWSGCAIDNAGFVYITGTGSDNGSVLVKYDAQNGDTIWIRRLHLAVTDEMIDCAVDKAHNVYITGNEYSSKYDLLTAKYSPNGDTAWVRVYITSGQTWATSCSADTSDGLYVVGVANSESAWIIMKYNGASGDTIWSRRFNSNTGNNGMPSSVLDAHGFLYVAGSTHPVFLAVPTLVKYDCATGDTIWTKVINYSDANNIGRSINASVIDDSGYIYAVGSRSNISDTATEDFFIVKFNSETGDTIWTRSYDGGFHGKDRCYGCAVDNKGGLYITGQSYNGINYDFLTMKCTTSTGDTVLSCRDDGTIYEPERALSCVTDSTGDLYVSGVMNIGGSGVIKTIKYETSTGVAGKPAAQPLATLPQSIRNAPNPFHGRTSILYSTHVAGRVNVTVYNMAGQRVYTIIDGHQQPGDHRIAWDGRDAVGNLVPAGVYFCRFCGTDGTSIGRMMVVR